MSSIKVDGVEYPLGDLTGPKAHALMAVFLAIGNAAAQPPGAKAEDERAAMLRLFSPELLGQAMTLAKAFGLPAETMPLHSLIAATRELLGAAVGTYSAYLIGPVRDEVQATTTAIQALTAGLPGASNGTAA